MNLLLPEEGKVRELGMNVYTLLYLKLITNKDLLYSTEDFDNIMCQPEWERSLGENGYMCMYGQVLLPFT